MQRYGKNTQYRGKLPPNWYLAPDTLCPSAELHAALVQVAPYPQHNPFSHPKDKVIK